MPVYHDDGVSTPVEVSDVIIDNGSSIASISEGQDRRWFSGTPEDFWATGPDSLRFDTSQTFEWPWTASQQVRATAVVRRRRRWEVRRWRGERGPSADRRSDKSAAPALLNAQRRRRWSQRRLSWSRQ